MDARKVQGIVPLGRLLLIAMVVAFLALSVSFISQVRAHSARRADLRDLEAELVQAQEVKAGLEKQLEFTNSDLAVRAWALQNGLAKRDETPVILVAPPTDVVPEDQLPMGKGPASDSPRQAWWELFFGSD